MRSAFLPVRSFTFSFLSAALSLGTVIFSMASFVSGFFLDAEEGLAGAGAGAGSATGSSAAGAGAGAGSKTGSSATGAGAGTGSGSLAASASAAALASASCLRGDHRWASARRPSDVCTGGHFALAAAASSASCLAFASAAACVSVNQ